MEAINLAFQQLNSSGRKAFVPYIMAGENGLEQFKEQLLFLQNEGVSIIEVGIPFSDPTADGPTIQAAGLAALAHGISLRKVLKFLKEIKSEIRVPIVLMSYFNPVFQYGIEEFVNDLKEAAVSGCIIPDLPLEEEDIIVPLLKDYKIAFIRLVTVMNSDQRLKEIVSKCEGFIYAVTVAGTTGTSSNFHNNFKQLLRKVKAMTDVPVLAGFGISRTEDVNYISEHCDGVIVGSRIIELFASKNYSEIKNLINS